VQETHKNTQKITELLRGDTVVVQCLVSGDGVVATVAAEQNLRLREF
jgi:hypothetical protein